MPVSRAEVRSRVLSRLEGNSAFYRQAVIDRAINHSVRVVNLFTGRLQGTRHVENFSVVSKSIYAIPPGIAIALAVYFENEALQVSSMRTFSLSHPRWTGETTAKVGTTVSRWIPIGISRFGIWPADAIGGNDIRVDGIIDPTFTNAVDEVIPFGQEALEAIVEHAVHILTGREGGRIFLNSTLRIFRASFRKKLEAMQLWSGKLMPHLHIELERKE